MRNKVFFYLGITSCFFAFRIGGIPIVAFPIFILLFISYYDFIKKKVININILSLYYILFLISVFYSLSYGIDIFKYNIKSQTTLNLIIYFFINTFLKKENSNFESFFKGLKIGIFSNLIWGSLEYISWIIYKFELNEFIFGKVLEISSGGHPWSNIDYASNIIRVSGMSWDPLTIGMLTTIGFIIYKNKYLKLYSIVILILSKSRAGMLALVLVELFNFIKKINKIEKKKVKLIRCIIILILPLIIFKGVSIILNSRNSFGKSKGDMRRAAYYTSAIEMSINRNFLTFLFGGAPNSSGTLLARNKEVAKKSYLNEGEDNIYWQIESDWAGILVGRGWIGLIGYIYIYILAYLKEKDEKIKNIILLFLFLGIGYYYDRSLIINIILIYSLRNAKNL